MQYQFKKTELEDREIITSYFGKAPSRSCERTFANVYLWSRHYPVTWAIIEDALVFKSQDETHLSWAYPAGEADAVKRALSVMKAYSEEQGYEFSMYSVTPEMFAQLETFFPGKFQIEYDRDEADYVYEREKLVGGILRVEGEIVAFTMGEKLCEDTFVVHIEKAYADVDGAYPMINQQFVQHECMDYQYVNREEDTGADGLRQAKMSYRPAFLEEKGYVTLKK